MQLYLQLAIFIIIVLAARQTGQFAQRVRMPLITGYLLLGMLAGPYLLGIIPSDAPENLRFIDQTALGFIAFAAGSELYLAELRSRLRSILWISAAQTVVTFTLGALAIYALGSVIPFIQNLTAIERLVIALLGAAILLARSPSSAIAIINELRARGPFTKTVLGVTMIMDVAIIVLFAINSSLGEGLLTGNAINFGVIGIVFGELCLAGLTGYLLGQVINIIFNQGIPAFLKTILLLGCGYGVFVISDLVRAYTHQTLPFEIFVEPLLVCMLAGIWVSNRTAHRDEFLALIQQAGPGIYVVFFTLTGASINLEVLRQTWIFALALFAVRLVSIATGSFIGGRIAGDPPQHNRLAWMAYVTQAGVGLGLAKNVAAEFPEWGAAFATLLISVIVVNQISGPPLMKIAIRQVKETHLQGAAQPDEVRDVLILGVESQSLALARQLAAHNWRVTLADTEVEHVKNANHQGLQVHSLDCLDVSSIGKLVTPATDALVAMLPDDDENLCALELAYEHYGVPRLIVRLNDLTRTAEFTNLGAVVVNPATAMVNLFDTFVRAPQSASLLLHQSAEYDLLQVTLTDPDVAGQPLRALRFPADVLVIGITRNGHAIVPHGSTELHLNDEVTLAGEPQHLEEIALRFGY